jgi:hypothetical protein
LSFWVGRTRSRPDSGSGRAGSRRDLGSRSSGLALRLGVPVERARAATWGPGRAGSRSDLGSAVSRPAWARRRGARMWAGRRAPRCTAALRRARPRGVVGRSGPAADHEGRWSFRAAADHVAAGGGVTRRISAWGRSGAPRGELDPRAG